MPVAAPTSNNSSLDLLEGVGATLVNNVVSLRGRLRRNTAGAIPSDSWLVTFDAGKFAPSVDRQIFLDTNNPDYRIAAWVRTAGDIRVAGDGNPGGATWAILNNVSYVK